MRNIFFTIAFTCCISGICAQEEKGSTKIVADRFELFFNEGKPDSIFGMFSTEMQKKLPLDKIKEFLTTLNSDAGNITQRRFIEYRLGYAVYKTNFERALFTINISIDPDSKINGLFVKPFSDDNLVTPGRNKTKLSLPFKDEWTVIWGGDTKEQNYHVNSQAQKNAFDLVITDHDNRSYKTNGETNEDYYAFGKELFAPCDGEIVAVVDGVKDNKPGEMNTFIVGGNMLVLKTGNNEYLVFCHFKHQSIKVKEGQLITRGQLLGLCGNTGNSSEPHLHFHIQNSEDINVATGIKCYFDQLKVNGKMTNDYSPVKGDKIKMN